MNNDDIEKWKEQYYLKHGKMPYVIEQHLRVKEKYDPQRRRKDRMKSDPLFKLSCNIRSLISMSYKKKKWNKTSKICSILGCDFDVLYESLLNSFIKNYNRKPNWNEKLDIDHIIPLSSAKTEDELVKLNHYSNLQWLKSSDNRKKSNKR